MNCGCTKNLGCFIPGQIIDFGITAPQGDDYIFEIYSNDGYSTIVVPLSFSQSISIPFTFNENSTTIIKVKLKFPQPNGPYYLTSQDGACMFEVSGIIPQC